MQNVNLARLAGAGRLPCSSCQACDGAKRRFIALADNVYDAAMPFGGYKVRPASNSGKHVLLSPCSITALEFFDFNRARHPISAVMSVHFLYEKPAEQCDILCGAEAQQWFGACR